MRPITVSQGPMLAFDAASLGGLPMLAMALFQTAVLAALGAGAEARAGADAFAGALVLCGAPCGVGASALAPALIILTIPEPLTFA